MSDNLNSHVRKHIVFALRLAAVMIGGALLLVLARKQGLLDGEQLMRANNVVIGLALAAYSNITPKLLYRAPLRSIRQATLAQAAARVSGWTMTLAFLVWAALWAFAPQEFARIASMAVVGASVTVSLGYAVWKSAACRTPSSH